MGISLDPLTEYMDKIFGGPESNRGLIQGIILLVIGIVIDAIVAGASAAITASAAAIIISNPGQYASLVALAAGISYISILGNILITLGIIGIVWWVVRKMEWVE